LDVALTSGQVALKRYGDLGDELGIALAQCQVGGQLAYSRRLAEAEPLLREALAAARKLGTRRLLAQVLRQVSTVHQINGDSAEARGCAAEALAIYEALGCKRFSAYMMAFALANIEFHAADAELALKHATEGLASLRALDYTQHNALLLCNMSTYLVYLGRYDEAEALAREALNLPSEQLAGPHSLTLVLQTLASVTALRLQGSSEHRREAYTRAARLLSFVDAHGPPLQGQSSAERRLHDKILAALRDALGAGVVADVMAEGALMTQEQAVKEASEI
jgi:tetratricopeptide (TPR) repeat protein